MGTPAAAKALNDAVLEGDTALRFRVIAALNKLHQTHPELERDRPLIETVLSAEISGTIAPTNCWGRWVVVWTRPIRP